MPDSLYDGPHYCGIKTARTDGVGTAQGVCDCGWRGGIYEGPRAGAMAASDVDGHYYRNTAPLSGGWPDRSS